MSDTPIEIEREVDARGLNCPLPILRAKKALTDLASGKVIGCEALARWDSPTFGAVGPDLFIPLAEQGGLIKAILEGQAAADRRAA